ncbi:MAG: TetR/AcrR family transcriptional regulator [Candidatus Hydrogenedentota bacterium]
MATRNTKTVIMDAAELMMAKHGIQGVSLRAILSEAGANSAALHYHFGSREGLIEAIIGRHGFANNLRRRELLEPLLESKDTVTTHDVINVIVDPFVEMLHEKGEAGRRFIRFLARLQSDQLDVHRALERQTFPDIVEGVFHLFALACPGIPEDELARRAAIIINTMIHSFANADVMSEVWEDDHRIDVLDQDVTTLKNFLSAGLAAPYRAAENSSKGVTTEESRAIIN